MAPKSGKEKSGMLSKGISIDKELYRAVQTKAQRESRSFSFIVCRAIERDLSENLVTQETPSHPAQTEELIDIREMCRILKISVWTARRRARRAGDPIRLAKSRIGKQKPMHFLRSKIEQIHRAA